MSRNSAQRGMPITLTATFLDAGGDYADATDLSMAVYPPGKDPRSLGVTEDDAWVYGVTLLSPGGGPQANPLETITKISTGKYEYIFYVPDDSELGAGFDKWEGTVDTVDLDETFSFTVVGGGSIGTNQLYINNAVFIKLDKTIADTDGNLLGSDNEFYFTTTYDPLYSSVRRVRLDLGALLSDIPDDVINLAIFEASLEANALAFGSLYVQAAEVVRFFEFARRQYVTCVAELTLLNAISGGLALGGSKSKRLADLQISYSNDGQFKDLLSRAIACKDKWQSSLTSAGEIGPGTSLRPSMVIKGRLDPDRPEIGRQWEPTSTYGIGSEYPAANMRHKDYYSRRWKRTFVPGRWSSRFTKE